MAVTAWKDPGTFGTWFAEWNKANRALAEDGFIATCDPSDAAADDENYAKFLFAIPTGDTIDGIEVQAKAQLAVGANTGLRVQLHWHNGLAFVAEGNTQDLASWDTSPLVFHSQGGATDLWGSTGWTPGKINGDGFGMKLSGIPSSGGKLDVDVVQIRIYHSSAGSVVPAAVASYRRRRSHG